MNEVYRKDIKVTLHEAKKIIEWLEAEIAASRSRSNVVDVTSEMCERNENFGDLTGEMIELLKASEEES